VIQRNHGARRQQYQQQSKARVQHDSQQVGVSCACLSPCHAVVSGISAVLLYPDSGQVAQPYAAQAQTAPGNQVRTLYLPQALWLFAGSLPGLVALARGRTSF